MKKTAIIPEIRRALQVTFGLLNLLISIAYVKLAHGKGLVPSPWYKRALARILRFLFLSETPKGGIPVQIRLTLEHLGPTFIKLGQILSIREDLIPDRVMRQLRKLQDEVPPFAFEDARHILETEFGKPLDAIFREFARKPLAAASLAQVHEARLVNGDRVVVKIQRPGIQSVIMHDLSLLRRLARALDFVPMLRRYRIMSFIEEFATYTMRELDFMQEATHAERFAKNFEDYPELIVPKVYREFTTRRVLTLEYIEGIKPDNREKLQKLGMDPKKLVELGNEIVLLQLFVHGFFHGDPHPGNLLVVGRNKFCLLDLGMAGTFSRKTMDSMFLFYYYLVLEDFEKAADYIINLTDAGPGADLEKFKAAVVDIGKAWVGAQFRQYSLGKLILFALSSGAKFGFMYRGDILLACKSIITIEAVGNLLDPQMDLATTSRKLMPSIIARRFLPRNFEEAARPIMKSIPELVRLVDEMPAKVLGIIDSAYEGGGTPNQIVNNNRVNYSSVVNAAIFAGIGILFLAQPWGIEFDMEYAEPLGMANCGVALVFAVKSLFFNR